MAKGCGRACHRLLRHGLRLRRQLLPSRLQTGRCCSWLCGRSRTLCRPLLKTLAWPLPRPRRWRPQQAVPQDQAVGQWGHLTFRLAGWCLSPAPEQPAMRRHWRQHPDQPCLPQQMPCWVRLGGPGAAESTPSRWRRQAIVQLCTSQGQSCAQSQVWRSVQTHDWNNQQQSMC